MKATELRDKGIKKAINNANKVEPSWSYLAHRFLLKYIKTNKQFMVEDLRRAADIPDPPSKRAWGGIVKAAANSGLIKSMGYRRTTNPKAHRTPANLWEVI